MLDLIQIVRMTSAGLPVPSIRTMGTTFGQNFRFISRLSLTSGPKSKFLSGL